MTLDLILLAVIAVVGWRLWRVLGTRTGFELPPAPDLPLEPARPSPSPTESLPPIWQDHAKEGSPLAKTLVEMAKIDPALDLSNFLAGAKIVHAKVLEAFSAGKLSEVKDLIAPDVYDALSGEVRARQARKETLHYQLVGYDSVRIESATFVGTMASFRTRFESRVISWTSDAAGKPTIGSPSKTESHVDYWTFERDLKSTEPNWLLIETDEAKDEG